MGIPGFVFHLVTEDFSGNNLLASLDVLGLTRRHPSHRRPFGGFPPLGGCQLRGLRSFQGINDEGYEVSFSWGLLLATALKVCCFCFLYCCWPGWHVTTIARVRIYHQREGCGLG